MKTTQKPMRKLILSRNNAESFAGTLRKRAHENGSMVFCKGNKRPGNKFGNLRKSGSVDSQKLTTKQVEVSVTEDGIRIVNPLNKSYGYSDFTIPFGKIVMRSNSLFWFDEWEMWRQMRFDKSQGWALLLSHGRAIPYLHN